MTCEHNRIEAARVPGEPITAFACECGHHWREHSTDLFEPDRVVGATALALLTPRDERRLSQDRLLGLIV